MKGWLLIWEPTAQSSEPINVRRGARNFEFSRYQTFTFPAGRVTVFSSTQPIEHDDLSIWWVGRLNEGFDLRQRIPEGDFARLTVDRRKSEVEIICDQLGFRSFFYTNSNNRWIFSNSLEALCLCPEVDLIEDSRLVTGFLLSNMVTRVEPSSTPFEGIFRSKPGSRWTISDEGVVQENQYWTLENEVVSKIRPSIAAAADELHLLLIDAVRDRVPSNGKVSLAQSGGLDSSLVGAVAHTLGAGITGFTISYDKIHKEEDWKYSQIVTKKFGWKQERLLSDEIPFYRPQDWDLDLMRSSVISATANLAENMANHASIGLNGLSADNILAKGLPDLSEARTYPAFLAKSLRQGEIPPLGLRRRRSASPTFNPSNFPWINNETFQLNGGHEIYESLSNLTKISYHPTHNYLAMSLKRFNWTERFRERLNYEALDPFFDLRLLRFSLKLDPFVYFQGKDVQRKLAEKLLPAEVAHRKKTILGDVYSSVLRVSNPEIVDHWEPHQKLIPFVNRAAVPPLTTGNLPPLTLFHATKPFWLNSWYEGLDRFLEFKKKLMSESKN